MPQEPIAVRLGQAHKLRSRLPHAYQIHETASSEWQVIHVLGKDQLFRSEQLRQNVALRPSSVMNSEDRSPDCAVFAAMNALFLRMLVLRASRERRVSYFRSQAM